MKINKNSKNYSNDYDKYSEVNESLEKKEPEYSEVAEVVIPIGQAPANRVKAAKAIETKDVKTLEGMTLGDVATPSELNLLKDKDKKKP
jgi:hypothetical protein